MDHALRTLLCDLFTRPPLRVLQAALELIVSTAGFLSAYVFGHGNQQTEPAAVITK